MDPNIDSPQSDLAPKIPGRTKLWWGLIPLLGLCTLTVCAGGGGFWLWQTISGPEIAASAVAQSAATTPEMTTAALSETAIPLLSSATPSASPTAEKSRANLGEKVAIAAMPELCQGPPQLTSPTITEPYISPISFATQQDEAGWPLDVSLQFAATITTVQASFAFAGLENGLDWSRTWYFGDQELTVAHGRWDAGPTGQLTLHVAAGEGGFAPGRYRLEIYVADKLMSQGSFLIAPPNNSLTRPVEVAYTTEVNGQPQINLLDLQTRQSRPWLEAARSPAWSSDANSLLFYSLTGLQGGTTGVWLQKLGSPENLQLINSPFSQAVTWSSDGLHLATWVEKEAGPNLVLWNLAGSQAFDGPVGSHPAWSPEGRRLVYRSCTKEGWNLSAIEIIGNSFKGDSLRQLTEGDDSQPSWSPDGQQIAFVRQEAEHRAIYVVNVDGSGLKHLTDGLADTLSPAWTPDKRLLYWSLQAGSWSLYLMNADGSNQQRVFESEAGDDWQPDSLAVSSDVVLIEPTPTPEPKPKVQVPAGQGVLVVSNLQNNDEMTFTIDNVEHKIPPYQYRTLPFAPGHYTWTASWPGKNSRTGIADIVLGQVSYPVVER